MVFVFHYSKQTKERQLKLIITKVYKILDFQSPTHMNYQCAFVHIPKYHFCKDLLQRLY